MLAISPLRNTHDIDGGRQQLQGVVVDGSDVHGAVEGFSADDNFSDMGFSGAGSLLDGIDFDDLFVGFGDGDDVDLPDLEVDPNELGHDFSVDDGSTEGSVGGAATASSGGVDGLHDGGGFDAVTEETSVAATVGGGEDGSSAQMLQMEEGMELEDDAALTAPATHDQQPAQQEEDTSAAGSADEMHSDDSGRKPSSSGHAKGPNGKRKVDWTPDLHRRFVQAVEQLGIDKAVPSRILEIMGIDCLTRHNIASHLQKYRSHRKHLMAREAEAATWSQRRHMYGAATGARKRDHPMAGGAPAAAPWLQAPPTLGFPPAPHPHPQMQPFRPLHVWGHPTVDHAMVHIWPKHVISPHGARPSTPWAAAPPHGASFWHYPRGMPNPMTQGTPCFPPASMPPQAPMQRFPQPPHSHPAAAGGTMYIKQEGGGGGLPIPAGAKSLHSFDLQPSKESIDAALGDVLSKPWLPLPLGLKPPSVDSVLVELQRQGISKIPPSSCA